MKTVPKVSSRLAVGFVASILALQYAFATEFQRPEARQAPLAIVANDSATEAKPKDSTAGESTSATAKTDDPSGGVAKTAVAKAKKPKEDLPNFHEVHPFLYRGGEPNEAGLRKLKEMGVKTIIDLRAPSEFPINEPKIAKELGLKYINLVMTSKAPTEKQVDTMLKEIKKAKEKPEDGSVFLHCAHGSDRTGSMIGIWRVTQEGMSYDDAYKEMRKYWFTPKFTNLSNAVKERASK